LFIFTFFNCRSRVVPADFVGRDSASFSSDSSDNIGDIIATDIGQGKATREDLDAAIEAGDWGAVGATAALLANSSDHDSGSEKMLTAKESNVSDLENSRTNELDRLVEAGDWEGVVMAAAQFEGDSDGGSLNDSRNHQSKEEIRAEVETLVKRVVPDEIDNIDEMMVQFEGREDELIETLRTMHERNVAQRARAAVNKSAKLEAKARAQTSQSSASSSTGRGRGRSVSNASDVSSVSELGMSRDQSSSEKSFLELAVERGDWQAVGEAAALMGEGTSGIIDDDTGGSSSMSSSLSTSKEGTTSSSGELSPHKEDRISKLDSLIAAGDWSGIVAAAGQYQAMDEQHDSSQSGKAPDDEEREALAQAEMWKAIAEQSKQSNKQEKKETKGASDAAEWAITRSLAKHKASEKSNVEDDESV
jgi:hypothetical protein